MVDARCPSAIGSSNTMRVDLNHHLRIERFSIERHLLQSVGHELTAKVNPLLKSRIEDDLHHLRRILKIPLRRIHEVRVLKTKALLALLRGVLRAEVASKT